MPDLIDLVVEDVHPKEGSIHGGTLLTITGKYFDEKSGIPVKVCVAYFKRYH